MTNLNILLRRLVALLLCVCMLIGNVGGALSELITDKVSEPVVPATYGRLRSSNPNDSVALSDYADLSYTLAADRDNTELPDALTDGQPLFFQLSFNLKTEGGLYLLRQAYLDGLVGPETVFTADISFLNLLENSNYPTSYDSKDNIASDNNVDIFRWWVDEETNKICLRFFESIFIGEGGISNTSVAFEGTLNVNDHDEDGQLHFGVDGETVSLIARQQYELKKEAGIPYYSVDQSSYLVDYTVTLTLDQNMKLDSSVADKLYCAALTLVDTVAADGALTGEISGVSLTSAPEGEEAAASIQDGTTNTIALTSTDGILKKGTYTIVYKMKVKDEAALAKLEGYEEEALRTNTVEVKENGESLETPLTATAIIDWKKVTEGQYKIVKNAYTEKAPDFKGVYWDEAKQMYLIDFHVVVYLKEEAETFTVTDVANWNLSFVDAAEAGIAPTLEGVDTSDDFWNNDINTATLTKCENIKVDSSISDGWVITITAPEGEKLQPGAYHLRVPGDVTPALKQVLEDNYNRYYQNTAYLTSVDGEPTNESDWFKQPIPETFKPTKSGGYEVDKDTGELLTYKGKPVIRWDVWLGWDFYDRTIFEDTLTGMELLVDENYSFDIHSFEDSKTIKKERLVHLTSLEDENQFKDFLTFNENLTSFTFDTLKLDKNPDNTPIKLYKLVYYTTPLTNTDGTYTTDVKNNYTVTHTPLYGDGFGSIVITGESTPTLTSNARLYVEKKHIIELNDQLTQWKITCTNPNNVPFSLLSNLDIIDLVPVAKNEKTIGEVNIHYSDEHPITVKMICDNNQTIDLIEGTHYTIVKQMEGYDFGTNGEHGFAVDLNMTAVSAAMQEKSAVYFQKIEVISYLENEIHNNGQYYDIHNDGWLEYTNQEIQLTEGVNAKYNRGFATLSKGVHPYNDYYSPDAHRKYYVCNKGNEGWQEFSGGYHFDPEKGDGQKEIVWRIYIGAREFGNDDNPIAVTVTDTLSDNQMFPTYEGKELKDLFLIRAENDGYRDYIILPDSVSVEGNTFTLTFTVPGGGWAGGSKDNSKNISIDYHTILKPDAITDALKNAPEGATSITVPYNNVATVTWNGLTSGEIRDSSSATFNTSMLDKTSEIISAVSEIEYSILINDHRLTLNEGRPLELTDTLGDGKENFLYRDDTLQLVNLDTGKVLTAGSSVSDDTYTITWATGETKGFTICVPDEQRLQLTYRVKPQLGVGYQTDVLTNSASLDGRSSSHVQDSFKVSTSNQEATYTPPTGNAAFTIRKLEGGSSVEILLPGAVFEAYPVKADGTLGEAIGQYTTDATGRVNVLFTRNGDNDYDTVYCIKEITAPAGYAVSNQEWYVYISTDNKQYANETIQALVETLEKENKVILRGFHEKAVQLNVMNQPITCDLRIYKSSTDGENLEGAVFVLQNANGNQMAAPVYSEENGVSCYTFTGLKSGTYTLTETNPPEGYKLANPNNWTIVLDAGNGNGGTSVQLADSTSEAAKAYVQVMTGNEVPSLKVLNDVADPVKLAIPVTKVLDGAETTQEAFTFTIEPVMNEGETKTVPMPAVTTATTNGATYTNSSTDVLFGDITYAYEHIGTYQYRITESSANAGSFISDTAAYLVTVKVEWKNDQLAASIASITKDGTTADKVTFTNTYVPYTSATVQKVWEDDEDIDGMRPKDLVVTLYADGEATDKQVTLNEENSWKATIEELSKFAADGKEIAYTWAEDEEKLPTGYAQISNITDGTNTTITNGYTSARTSITVEKFWNDNDDQDGKRSDVIATVALMKTVGETTEQVGEAVTVGTEDDWSKTWTDLPVYEDGTPITYSVVEVLETANGYTSDTTTAVEVANSGNKTITNTHAPESTTITVNKVWNDNNDQDGKRSDVVAKVTLKKTVDGTTSEVESVTVGAEDDWSKTWTALPVYESGKPITYSVVETLVTANGYTSDTTEAATVANGSSKTITNSFTPESTAITVNKVWNDNNDQDGKRSDVVAKVTLKKTVDGTTSDVESVTVGTEDDWSKTWTALPVYEGGKPITYSVVEVLETANGYTSDTTTAVEVANGSSKTITNTHAPETIEVAGSKTWDDANDQDGLRPDSITINLLADGKIIDTIEVKEDAKGSWKWSFTDLPKYRDQGVEIVYSITETLDETTAAAYSVKVNGNNVTNTHTPATVDVAGSKVWIDLNDSHHTRPKSITIRLLADGKEIASRTVSVENNWSWSFTDLPKYAEGKIGQEVVYTVTEDSVAGYVTTQNGYSFTNTVQVVAFQKLDEQTGNPLSGAGFALYEGRLTAPAGTPLTTWTSTSAPQVLAGLTTGQTYTIFETKTPFGYITMSPFVFTVQKTDTPANLRTLTATNRHSYRFRKLSSSDNELVYGAEMAIMQGDTIIATWLTNYENDGWHYVADHRFKAGVTYTLVELSAPNGYRLASPMAFSIDPKDGFLIVSGIDTNDMSVVMYDQPVPAATPTPEPTTTTFRVTKQWEDQDNVLGLRPNSIVVNLFRKTGNEADYPASPFLTVTMNSDGTDEWTFTFSDLPRRDSNGRLYTYMAQEEPVEGYVASYLNNGRTIVNSIPVEDLPPTPTPTLPYVTPTPSPMPRVPAGVQFINGKWVYVDEYGVPLGGVPLTGDNTNFALWGCAIVLPMLIAALAAVELRRRKRQTAMEGKEK